MSGLDNVNFLYVVVCHLSVDGYLVLVYQFFRIFYTKIRGTKRNAGIALAAMVPVRVRAIVFNATFNSISVISWRVLLMEETG